MTTLTFTPFDYTSTPVAALVAAISAKEATLFSGWSYPQPLSDAQVTFIQQRVETLLDLMAKGVWTGNPLNGIHTGAANWTDIDSTTYPAGVNAIGYFNPVQLSQGGFSAFAANLLGLGDSTTAQFEAEYQVLRILDVSSKQIGLALVRARKLGEMPVSWYLASDGVTAMVSIFEYRISTSA